jgi:tRNA nucleotidyltransferase (CCA-adding enzyme)
MQRLETPVLSSRAGKMVSPLAKQLITAITTQGQLYEVGGAVRDSLIPGQPPSKDIDFLVAGIPYQELVSLLRRFGRVDLVGRSFGVIKFTQHASAGFASETFDFVLPRKEYSTGTGHRDFAVEFDHNLRVEDDLGRRDFTINAIARNVATGEIVDPFSGQEDIQAGLIRIAFPNSFVEDPLRMLRAIQFAARFSFEIEPQTYAAIRDSYSLIKTVSPERIAEELNKLLVSADKPSVGLILMQRTGMLKVLLPELERTVGVDQPGPFHAHPVFEHSILTVDAAPRSLTVRMSALFHDVAKPQAKQVVDRGATFYGHEDYGARVARKVLERLRYANDFIDQVVVLIERHMFTTDVSDKGMRRLIRKVGQELVFDLLDLRRADVVGQGKGGKTDDVDEFEQRIREELERKPPFGLADLALNGSDIMREFGIGPGKEIGEILNHLLELVLDFPEKNSYDVLLEEARAYLRAKA